MNGYKKSKKSLIMICFLFVFSHACHAANKHNAAAAIEASEKITKEQWDDFIEKEREQLVEAAKAGKLEKVANMYAQSRRNNLLHFEHKQDDESIKLPIFESIGCHALSLAACHGDIEVVKALIDQGVNVNEYDAYGYVPILWAASCNHGCKLNFGYPQCNHAAIISFLIDSGAQCDVTVDKKFFKRESLLDFVVRFGNSKSIFYIVKKLSENDKSHTYKLSPLLWAIKHNILVGVQAMIMDKDNIVSTKERDAHGDTAVMWAVKCNDQEMLKLVAEKEDIMVENKDGETPLSYACKHKNVSATLFLAHCASQKDTQNGANWAALAWASWHGYYDVVELLLKKKIEESEKVEEGKEGVVIDEQDNLGNTALHWAIESGHTAIVEMLIENNANVNLVNKEGWTPFTLASRNGNGKVVSLIMQKLKDGNEQGKYGRSPLAFAARYGHGSTVQRLLDHGLVVDECDEDGNTPLYWACRFGHFDSAYLLIQHGADVNKKNVYGWTPLYWASRNRHAQVVRLLLDAGAQVDDSLKYGVMLPYASTTRAIKNVFTNMFSLGSK